ncbi:uncharacterized protein LOC110724348 [Chenopodium quinoa]|uniref:uncharacterized protein LOC110724348 n=1 Tax=Chenopodium quinoa TaxID=63459 RepID=UPI000B78DC13|nr:uncharacterized protein LOC110724348 [Chenopodium quinoa]
MAGQQVDVLFREFGNPEDYELTSGILLPVTETNFTIHPQYTRMVQAEQFSGSPSEDPIEHLDRFLELCAMIQTNQVSQEYIRMHLFRHSLAGRAKKWLKQVKPNSLTTWREIVQAFLKRFISEEKTVEMRRKIASFEQEADESLSEAWERFKELIRRNAPKKGGKYELEKVDQLQHQIELLTKGLAKLNTSVNSGARSSQVNSFSCQNCGGTNHDTSYCGGPKEGDGKEKKEGEERVSEDKEVEEEKVDEKERSMEKKKSKDVVTSSTSSEARNLDGPVPFPGRLAERKLNDKFAKFLSVMKNLYIKLPFIEVVTQMPSYSKLLKDILTNKRKLNDELITLPHQLNIEMIPTRKTIPLADRSVKLPCGELEDVPIQVGYIYVPCDFVVMDMEEDVDTPLILGREALKTLGAVINCKNNTITCEVADEKIFFEFSKLLKTPIVEK